MLMTISVIVYELKYKPFSNEFTNRVNLFNEFTILMVSYHLPLLTDFVDDVHIQYNVGYSIMAFTLSNILVNSLIMIIKDLKLALYKILNFCRRRYISKMRNHFKNKLRTIKALNTVN
jgi:hypothetical protein